MGPRLSTPEAPEAERLLASSWEDQTTNITLSGEMQTTHQVEQGKCVVYLPNNLEQSERGRKTGRRAINQVALTVSHTCSSTRRLKIPVKHVNFNRT